MPRPMTKTTDTYSVLVALLSQKLQEPETRLDVGYILGRAVSKVTRKNNQNPQFGSDISYLC